MGKKQAGQGKHFLLYFASFIILFLCSGGCQSTQKMSEGDISLKDSRVLMVEGYFHGAIEKNQETLNRYPQTHGDQALLQNGLIYAHPLNMSSDHKKSKESLQKLLTEYPNSVYGEEAIVILELFDQIEKKDKEIDRLSKEVKNYIDNEEQEEIETSYKLEQLIKDNKALKRTNVRLQEQKAKLKNQLKNCSKEAYYMTEDFTTVLVEQLEECRKKVEQLKEIDLEIQKKKRESMQK